MEFKVLQFLRDNAEVVEEVGAGNESATEPAPEPEQRAGETSDTETKATESEEKSE